MPTPVNNDEFLDLVRKSAVVDDKRLSAYLDKVRAAAALPADPQQLAQQLVREGLLTFFQADQLLAGKWKRFTIGKYKVLERLGAGGMGSVYLCEHKLMRRRVAVKVLPSAKADDPSSLERFQREARAVAALDHPNIVRAYDIDQDDKLHFLVLEYVDGASLQEIIKKTGPMDVLRAAHYARQAALGLQHAHETAGLVHRDVKPGNVLVDRNGIVKILDMGLARFFHDTDDILTKKYDENVLGTADYLAPEQALDSHGVDIRADIYSLGGTFYFCLTAKTPFSEGTVAQKLIWHQTRQPKPIRSIRPDVPEELVAIIDKMMAKDPGQRYQTPQAVADALAPFTETSIGPPPDNEMPQVSLAARGTSLGETSMTMNRPNVDPSPAPRKVWQVNAPATPSQGPTAAAPVPSQTVRGPTAPPSQAVAPSSVPPGARPAVAPVAKALSALPATPSNGPLRQPTQTMPTFAVPKAPTSTSIPAVKSAPAAVTAKPDAPVAEEAPSWDKLTPGGADPSGRFDTSSKGKRPTSGVSRSRRGHQQTPSDRRTMIWVAIIAATVLVLLALAVGIWLAVSPANVEPHAPPVQARPPLVVNPGGGDSAFKTLQQAIDKANANDRILIKGHIQESVVLDGKDGLVIEGEKDLSIQWSPPNQFPAGTALPKLLTLNTCRDCKIQNLELTGGPKGVDVLVNIFGRCPGVTLQDLKLNNYTSAGILITNAEGSKDHPILLSGLDFTNQLGSPEARAIAFEVRDNVAPRKNSFITIKGGSISGTGLQIVNQKGKRLTDFEYPKELKFEEK